MNQILRGVLGVVIILIGLVGLGMGIYGVFWLQDVADDVERDLVSAMDNGLEGLEVISDTLVIVVQTVDDAGTVLDAAAESSRSAGGTIEAIRPAVTEMSDIVAVDLPNNIEMIQDAMPALEEAGAAIDKTLRSLADFQWRATIPLINYPLEFGLGIEYDPPVPLDQSVAEMNAALEELPNQLLGIQSSLLETDLALGETADSMQAMGDSLATVHEDLNNTAEVLAEYEALVSGATGTVRSVRRDLRDRIEGIRLTVTGILIWLVLSQLAPLYLGATLLIGRPATEESTR